ncbi:MAG: type III secretion system chaperone [Desulfobacteraceae bacterium]|nr:type III secretion system chaperone [Desulfobacteraceae bacterium]
MLKRIKRFDFTNCVQTLERQYNLGQIQPEENGGIRLLLDNSIEIFLTPMGHRKLALSAKVITAGERIDFFMEKVRSLMAEYTYHIKSSKDVFAIDSQNNAFILYRLINTEECTSQSFLMDFEDFIKSAAKWTKSSKGQNSSSAAMPFMEPLA